MLTNLCSIMHRLCIPIPGVDLEILGKGFLTTASGLSYLMVTKFLPCIDSEKLYRQVIKIFEMEGP